VGEPCGGGCGAGPDRGRGAAGALLVGLGVPDQRARGDRRVDRGGADRTAQRPRPVQEVGPGVVVAGDGRAGGCGVLHQGARAFPAELGDRWCGLGGRGGRVGAVRPPSAGLGAAAAGVLDLPQSRVQRRGAGGGVLDVRDRRVPAGHDPAVSACGGFHPPGGRAAGRGGRDRVAAHRAVGRGVPAQDRPAAVDRRGPCGRLARGGRGDHRCAGRRVRCVGCRAAGYRRRAGWGDVGGLDRDCGQCARPPCRDGVLGRGGVV